MSSETANQLRVRGVRGDDTDRALPATPHKHSKRLSSISGMYEWPCSCCHSGMVWFFEKDADLVVCEIRRAADSEAYEFEVAHANGPITRRFDSPTELITKYLEEQARLISEGWRPRGGDTIALG